jgi:hypothetical protein
MCVQAQGGAGHGASGVCAVLLLLLPALPGPRLLCGVLRGAREASQGEDQAPEGDSAPDKIG